MPHILKIIKGVVKTLGILVTIAFVFNSSSGFLGAVGLADGETIAPAEIEPGDFVIDYLNLAISIGLDVNNTGIYALEDIVVNITFEIRNSSTPWYMVLEKTTPGVDIAPGNSTTVGISANQIAGDFNYNSTQIGGLLGLSGLWTYTDLVNAGFEARMNLGFTVNYAFKQYAIKVNLFFDDTALAGGFA